MKINKTETRMERWSYRLALCIYGGTIFMAWLLCGLMVGALLSAVAFGLWVTATYNRITLLWAALSVAVTWFFVWTNKRAAAKRNIYPGGKSE